MDCHRCAQPIGPHEHVKFILHGAKRFPEHIFCPRIAVEGIRMREDKMLVAERRARGAV